MPQDYHVKFDFGDRVTADGEEILMVVTGVILRRDDDPIIECQYWFNGDLKVVNIAAWRLKLCV